MRIVYLAAGAGQMYCGACARDITLVRGLIARGHDVQIVPLYTPLKIEGGLPVEAEDVFLGGINAYLQQKSALFRVLPPALDRFLDNPALLRFVSRFAISTKPSQLGAMTVSVLAGKHGQQSKEFERLIAHLEAEGAPDVFVITNSLLSGLAPLLKARFGKPVLCGLQGEESFVEALAPYHRLQAWGLIRRNALHVDLFIAPGDSHAASMVELLGIEPERVRVVRTGLDVSEFAHDGPRRREPFTLGYLSLITPHKGLDVLVKAWHRLVKVQGRDVRLRVAGRVLDSYYWKQIESAIERAGLRDRFEYVGEPGLDEKIEFLRGCSVFSLPSRFEETRGLAVMEAMATGVPVVVPDSGVFPEMLELAPGGRLFPSEDFRALSGEIAALMDDPDEADRLGHAGADTLPVHYHSDQSVEAMLEVLAEVTEGVPTPTDKEEPQRSPATPGGEPMPTPMTSRERVLAALNHQESDRVPIDFSGHRSSGIAAIAYPRLRELLGLAPRTVRVYDPIQQLAIVDEDVLDRFGVDTIEMGRGFALDDDSWADWTLPDGSPCQMPAWALPERGEEEWILRSDSGRVIARMPDGALYFEQTHWPFLEGDDQGSLEDAFGESMWTAVGSPPGPLMADAEALEKGAKALRDSTDRAIIGLFGGNLVEVGQFLYRIDNFLMLLAADPARAHGFLDRLVEFHLANLERFLGTVGPYIDIIAFGDDLGMQTGPQFSPEMYREFFKPRHSLLWRQAKKLANVKVMLHSCGGLRELLPDIIEAGADAVNPVQITCSGMDAAGLKRDFGKDITLWGGACDTRDILPNGTPEEVRRHVAEQIAILRPGGGFVFQQVHNILADVPPENIVAMLDAARERGA